MEQKRQQQIECLLKAEISRIVCTRMRDPLIGFVTITNIQLSKDGRSAKVFFSVLGDETIQDNTLKGLQRARGFIQNELKSRVHLKYHPVLQFQLDRDWSRANQTEEGKENMHHPVDSF